jgi:hypothetical protein
MAFQVGNRRRIVPNLREHGIGMLSKHRRRRP